MIILLRTLRVFLIKTNSQVLLYYNGVVRLMLIILHDFLSFLAYFALGLVEELMDEKFS